MRKKWTRRFRTNVPQPIRLTAASAKFGIEAGLSEFNTPNCGNRGDKSSNGTIFYALTQKKSLGINAIGIGRKRFPRRIAGMGATYRSVINFFI
jgi:hypothetical protein